MLSVFGSSSGRQLTGWAAIPAAGDRNRTLGNAGWAGQLCLGANQIGLLSCLMIEFKSNLKSDCNLLVSCEACGEIKCQFRSLRWLNMFYSWTRVVFTSNERYLLAIQNFSCVLTCCLPGWWHVSSQLQWTSTCSFESKTIQMAPHTLPLCCSQSWPTKQPLRYKSHACFLSMHTYLM
jgi:hypothetical protein